MIIPVLNMDVTPAVQLMIVISYIALVYGLSVEIIGYHPFGRTIKPKVVNVKIENPATESAAKQRKTISREGCDSSSSESSTEDIAGKAKEHSH